MIQSLSGRKEFVKQASEEGFSALAHSFSDVMRAREAGSLTAFSEAAREFRLFAASTINSEYRDDEVQMDSRELLLLIYQTIVQEIEENRAQFGLPPQISFVESEFKVILESLKQCTT